MNCGGTVVCSYAEFPDHFGFFMPLAGITTVEHISENSFEIKATGRLNKLYFELLKDNPDWATRLYLMSLGGLIHKRSLTNRLGIQLGLLPIVTLP